jgi:hypothetical protein
MRPKILSCLVGASPAVYAFDGVASARDEDYPTQATVKWGIQPMAQDEEED